MGGKNEHAHEHLQFYTFNMSLLGRKKGKRTGLLKSPVQCIPTQKTEQELHSISSGFTVDWRETAALCDKWENLLNSVIAIMQGLPKRKKVRGAVPREFRVNDSFSPL